MPTAIENMQRAMRTFEERSKKYGDNYKHFGRLMGALYPKGFSASSEEEWNRLGLIVMIASKLSRYVKDPYNGHLDSIHDLGVYAFMLEEIDSLSCRTCGALFTDGRCLSCGAKMDARMEEVLASACEHVYANQKCIVCGEKEPEHKLGWQVIQEANKLTSQGLRMVCSTRWKGQRSMSTKILLTALIIIGSVMALIYFVMAVASIGNC
jgi:hypothetical protein